MKPIRIPFNRPHQTGQEQHYLNEVLASGQTAAGGPFSQRCEHWLETRTGALRVLLTSSCTHALELAAVLADIRPGDEVIMPSFTFTSTATAFVLRGAVPVFVDIRQDTLNIDERLIEAAITERTRAIVPVHYAGVACEMDTILDIARRHQLLVIEDAAQCIGATYKGKALGTLGDLGCYSFHMTKNLSCGEGGALLINRREWIERAEIVHDKGTTRAQFRAGRIRQYDWVDVGMSAPPSELQAAWLLAQLQHCDSITLARQRQWQAYLESLQRVTPFGIQLPIVPEGIVHNGHLFYLLFDHPAQRDASQRALMEVGIQAALHYQPLHQAVAGQRLGRAQDAMPQADSRPQRLLRLPLWPGMPECTVDQISETLFRALAPS